MGIVVGIMKIPLIGMVGGEEIYAIPVHRKLSLSWIYNQHIFS